MLHCHTGAPRQRVGRCPIPAANRGRSWPKTHRTRRLKPCAGPVPEGPATPFVIPTRQVVQVASSGHAPICDRRSAASTPGRPCRPGHRENFGKPFGHKKPKREVPPFAILQILTFQFYFHGKDPWDDCTAGTKDNRRQEMGWTGKDADSIRARQCCRRPRLRPCQAPHPAEGGTALGKHGLSALTVSIQPGVSALETVKFE